MTSLVRKSIAALGLWIAVACFAGSAPANQQSRSCVILLHGISMNAATLWPLERFLEGRGYVVVNHSYPSRQFSIPTLAEGHISRSLRQCARQGAMRVNFVTHSLGGILVRSFFQDGRPLPQGMSQGRIVMLVPPNGGSEVSDLLQTVGPYQWWFGPAGQQLGTGSWSVPKKLGPIEWEIGIVGGVISRQPWFRNTVPGADDGVVSLQATTLPEMTDHITLAVSHTGVVYNPSVWRQAETFLRFGRFGRISDDSR